MYRNGVCLSMCVQIKLHVSSCFLNSEDLTAVGTCIPRIMVSHIVLQEGKLNVLGKDCFQYCRKCL